MPNEHHFKTEGPTVMPILPNVFGIVS